MKKYSTYKDFLIWQKAIELTKEVYAITTKLPGTEVMGLTSQSRRAACSIALNIAEGYGRKTKPSFIYFLRNSIGSVYELETCLILMVKLEFLNDDEISHARNLISEETAMLLGFIKKLGQV